MLKKLKNTPFLFSCKSWLTCLFLSPIINFFIIFNISTTSYSDFLWIFLYSFLLGGLLSLPAFGCLLLLTYYLRNKDWDIQLKRGILVLISSALAIASFYLLPRSGSIEGLALIIMTYILTLNIGLIIYKFPQKATDPIGNTEID